MMKTWTKVVVVEMIIFVLKIQKSLRKHLPKDILSQNGIPQHFLNVCGRGFCFF